MKRLADLALVTTVVLVAVALLRPFEPEVAAEGIDIHPTMWALLAAPDIETAPPPEEDLLRRPRRAAGPLDAEMLEACLAVAADLDERLAEQLRALRDRDRPAFERRMSQSRRLIAMAELKKRDPGLYYLKLTEMDGDAQVSRLAAELREARRTGSAQAARLQGELQRKVIIQLTLRYKTREDYLCRLQETVARMERELEHDREHFNELLAARMKELLETPAP